MLSTQGSFTKKNAKKDLSNPRISAKNLYPFNPLDISFFLAIYRVSKKQQGLSTF